SRSRCPSPTSIECAVDDHPRQEKAEHRKRHCLAGLKLQIGRERNADENADKGCSLTDETRLPPSSGGESETNLSAS
ncbi:hypothetical protein ACCS66_39005, partial [Rhizobium ruizarguesonis]